MKLTECFVIFIIVVVVIFLLFNFSESFERFHPPVRTFYAINQPRQNNMTGGAVDTQTSSDSDTITTNTSNTSVTGSIPAVLSAQSGPLLNNQILLSGNQLARVNLPPVLPSSVPEKSEIGIGKYLANINEVANKQLELKKSVNRPSKVLNRCHQVAQYYIGNNLELSPELADLPIAEVYDKLSGQHEEMHAEMKAHNCLNKQSIFNTQGFRVCENDEVCDEPTGIDLRNNCESY